MTKAVVVLSPYYEGTSFDEISRALQKAAESYSGSVTFIKQPPIKNTLTHNNLDDESYISGQIHMLGRILEYTPESDEEVKFIFLDAFNPGLDLIKYSHQKKGITAKYTALLHGGTYLSDDLYDFPWLKKYEDAWFNTYDALYVSSPYSRSQLTPEFRSKARVFPWGLDAFVERPAIIKEIDVIFPHRLDRDKGADEFFSLAKQFPNKVFAITVSSQEALKGNPYIDIARKIQNVCFHVEQNDEEHTKTLGKAKVVFSNAKQELYGYSIMKSVLSGCIPVLPNRQCYPDYFPQNYLYADFKMACEMVDKYTSDYDAESRSAPLTDTKQQIREHSFKALLNDVLSI